MREEVQQPEESPGMHGGTRFNHPAFGMVGAARISGNTTLYGSDFVHQHFVRITVQRSEFERDLARDWHYGGREIVEVWLSEAQWASFVSSMNVGNGVPCTIKHIGGERAPNIPLRNQEAVYRAEVKARLAGAAGRARSAIADIEGELGASLSNKKREAILAHLRKLERDITDTLPYVAKSFEEHMEDTVEKAKVEVNAYMQQAVTRAGLAALAGGDTGPLALGSGAHPDPNPED